MFEVLSLCKLFLAGIPSGPWAPPHTHCAQPPGPQVSFHRTSQLPLKCPRAQQSAVSPCPSHVTSPFSLPFFFLPLELARAFPVPLPPPSFSVASARTSSHTKPYGGMVGLLECCIHSSVQQSGSVMHT